jgi:sortase A
MSDDALSGAVPSRRSARNAGRGSRPARSRRTRPDASRRPRHAAPGPPQRGLRDARGYRPRHGGPIAQRRARRRLGLARALVSVLLVFVGMGVLVYPVAATQFNNTKQQQFAETYNQRVAQAPTATLAQQLEGAHAYNAALKGVQAKDPWGTLLASGPSSAAYADYLSRLSGLGAMARLRIPSIGVDLPVYHSTSDETIAKGIGHLYGTALPVGGVGTHSVLTSHTGMANATLLDHLIDVREGSAIYVDVAGETLAYQVDQIKVVLPTDIEDLAVDPATDLLTVFTCTPYAVNTHRLLVRGHRIAFDPVVAAAAQPVRPGLVMEPWMYWLIGAAAASFLSLGVALGTAVRARSRRPAPALGGRASVVRQRRRGNRFGRGIAGR